MFLYILSEFLSLSAVRYTKSPTGVHTETHQACTHTYTHVHTRTHTKYIHIHTHVQGVQLSAAGAHTHTLHTKYIHIHKHVQGVQLSAAGDIHTLHTHTHTYVHTHVHTRMHTKYIHIQTHLQGVQLSAAGGRLVQEDGKNEIEHPRAGDGETPQGLPFGGGIRGGLEGRGGMLHGNGSGEREGEGEGARADVSSLLPAPPEEPLHPLSALTKATPSQLLQWQVRVSWLSEFLCAAVLIVRLCIPCLRCCSGRCGFRGFQSSSVQL